MQKMLKTNNAAENTKFQSIEQTELKFNVPTELINQANAAIERYNEKFRIQNINTTLEKLICKLLSHVQNIDSGILFNDMDVLLLNEAANISLNGIRELEHTLYEQTSITANPVLFVEVHEVINQSLNSIYDYDKITR